MSAPQPQAPETTLWSSILRDPDADAHRDAVLVGDPSAAGALLRRLGACDQPAHSLTYSAVPLAHAAPAAPAAPEAPSQRPLPSVIGVWNASGAIPASMLAHAALGPDACALVALDMSRPWTLHATLDAALALLRSSGCAASVVVAAVGADAAAARTRQGLSDDHVAYVQHYLRRACVDCGAALAYVPASRDRDKERGRGVDGVRACVVHALGGDAPKAELLDPDALVVPRAWDTAEALDSCFGSSQLSLSTPFEEVVPVPESERQQQQKPREPTPGVAQPQQQQHDFLVRLKEFLETGAGAQSRSGQTSPVAQQQMQQQQQQQASAPAASQPKSTFWTKLLSNKSNKTVPATAGAQQQSGSQQQPQPPHTPLSQQRTASLTTPPGSGGSGASASPTGQRRPTTPATPRVDPDPEETLWERHYAAFAVFDGHAGDRAAQYVQQHLPVKLAQCIAASRPDVNKALIDAFKQTDAALLQEAGAAMVKWKDGCTANLALLIDGKDLYVANVGDSRAVLCTLTEHSRRPAGEDDGVAGGLVTEGRVMGMLEVTRSFGDLRFKSKCGVVSTPEVRHRELTDDDAFFVVASDGLWKVVDDAEAVRIVHAELCDRAGTATQAAKALVDEALARGTHDNVTAVVVVLPGDIKMEYNAVAAADSLLSNMRCYADFGRVRSDVINVLRSYPSLKPAPIPSTRGGMVLGLTGTIPIVYKGGQYNIPVRVCVTEAYPQRPPEAFVQPTPGMVIVDRHPHVDSAGVVYLPYLNTWQAQACSLAGLVQTMSQVFSLQPPLWSQPKPSPPASPPGYPSPQSQARQQQQQQPYMGSAYMPQVAYPQQQQPVGASYGSPYPPYPYPQQQQQQQPPVSQYQVGAQQYADPRRPRIAQLTERVRARLAALDQASRAELDRAYARQQSLREAESQTAQAREDIARRTAACAADEQRARAQAEEAERAASAYAGKTADEVAVSDAKSTPFRAQRERARAEDLAIDDLVYAIDRSLTRGTLGLDEYLRAVRSLAADQFMQRAVLKKCSEAC
eukprot:m51a1_g1782 putative tumor susceptibility gene 101 protein (1029) ;mRNA; r:346341-351975